MTSAMTSPCLQPPAGDHPLTAPVSADFNSFDYARLRHSILAICSPIRSTRPPLCFPSSSTSKNATRLPGFIAGAADNRRRSTPFPATIVRGANFFWSLSLFLSLAYVLRSVFKFLLQQIVELELEPILPVSAPLRLPFPVVLGRAGPRRRLHHPRRVLLHSVVVFSSPEDHGNSIDVNCPRPRRRFRHSPATR